MTYRGVNAKAESVVGLYKNECVKIDGPFRTVDELELATLSWVHWFNENRLHSSIDYKAPLEAERDYYRNNQPQASHHEHLQAIQSASAGDPLLPAPLRGRGPFLGP